MMRMSAPFVSRIDRGPDAGERLVARDHGLSLDVATALGRHLVLEHDAGKARLGVAANRALDVLRAAESRVAVADIGTDAARQMFCP